MILAIGDLHLSDSRPWSYDVSKRLVDWISNAEWNNPKHVAVFLGDITEDTFLSGRLFYLMLDLFNNMRFKKTYVLVGNHDLREDKNNHLSLTYEFLRDQRFNGDGHVQIIDKPIEIGEEQMYFLALPWLHSDGRLSVADYSKLKSDINFDILFGHFQESTIKLPGDHVDIEQIKTKYHCFGHIHNPSQRYIGAAIPNKWDEAGFIRSFRWYEKSDTGHNVMEVIYPIPVFTDYYAVTFPEPLPQVPAQVPVWTVFNCKDEATARQQYGNIYIRKAIYDVTMDTEAFSSLNASMSNKSGISVKQMFQEWINKAEVEPEIKKLALEYYSG